jgi:hypothetical protein
MTSPSSVHKKRRRHRTAMTNVNAPLFVAYNAARIWRHGRHGARHQPDCGGTHTLGGVGPAFAPGPERLTDSHRDGIGSKQAGDRLIVEVSRVVRDCILYAK